MADIRSVGMAFLNTSVYGGIPNSYWTVMMEDIASALQRRGDFCVCINPESNEHRNMLKMMVLSGIHPRYLLLFNFAPAFAQASDRSELGALGGMKCPYISLFLDHPALLGTRIAEMEAMISADKSLRPLRHYGLMEHGHMAIMEKLGVPASSCFVFPQAGAPPVAAPRPIDQRSITAIFAGTIEAEISNQMFCEQIGLREVAHCRLAEQAVSEAIDGDDDVFVIVAKLFGDTELASETRDLVNLTKKIDYRARTIRRHRMFRCLRDLPIQYYGNAADDFKRSNTNVNFKGNIGFRGLLDVMNDSKVILNDTINLRSSTLIRVFYGMSRGCLVASEVNSFLRSEFIDKKAAVPIEKNDPSVGEKIRHLANQPAESQAIIDTATQVYSSSHTWDHRIATLLETIAV